MANNANRSLQAEHLKPVLAGVEKKAGTRCYHKCPEIRALAAHPAGQRAWFILQFQNLSSHLPYPLLTPLYTPCIPPVYPFYSHSGGIQGV